MINDCYFGNLTYSPNVNFILIQGNLQNSDKTEILLENIEFSQISWISQSTLNFIEISFLEIQISLNNITINQIDAPFSSTF